MELERRRLLGFTKNSSPLQHTPSFHSAAVLQKTGISCFRQQCQSSGMNSENDLPNGAHLVVIRGFLLQLEQRSSLGCICISCTSEELDTLFHNILFSIIHLYRLLTTRRLWFVPGLIFVRFLVNKAAILEFFSPECFGFSPVIIILPMLRSSSFVCYRRPTVESYRLTVSLNKTLLSMADFCRFRYTNSLYFSCFNHLRYMHFILTTGSCLI